jgi:hypothetical protein
MCFWLYKTSQKHVSIDFCVVALKQNMFSVLKTGEKESMGKCFIHGKTFL